MGEGCDHRGPAGGDFGGNGNHLHFDSGGNYCMRVTKLIEQYREKSEFYCMQILS